VADTRSGKTRGSAAGNFTHYKNGKFLTFKQREILLFLYFIRHCFICRPSDDTVSECAGIDPRTDATLAWQSDSLATCTRLDILHILDIKSSLFEIYHNLIVTTTFFFQEAIKKGISDADADARSFARK
jgi:hypothetical protein